jgi:triosephosphate isomerase
VGKLETMRNKIVAGNWKMNKSYHEGISLINDILNKSPLKTKVIIAPPYLILEKAQSLVNNNVHINIAAQNCHHEENGAYTGEISCSMLKSINVNYTIIGHSERRTYNNENDTLLKKKVDQALIHNIKPIFCCGENLDQRKSSKHFDVIEAQLNNGVFHLDKNAFHNLIIAYEPVWAIGTGETATPEQAQEIHFFIRQLIEKKYGPQTATSISILYGGSCKPSNAFEIFSQKDVDGGLIGGASLNAKDFHAIIDASEQV